MSKSSNNTQLVQANAALLAIAANVTAEDRKAAQGTPVTISTYLQGKGKDLDTAMAYLKFFKGRIEDRQRTIDAARTVAA